MSRRNQASSVKWKFALFIASLVLEGFVSGQSDQILVRSHGQTAADDRSFEAVLGLNVVPRNVIRVRVRDPKDASETLAAAAKAARKAEEIQRSSRNPAYRDLDPDDESGLEPVSLKNNETI